MTCQQNSNIILKSVNKSVEEKSAVSIKSKIVSMHVLEVSMHYLIITNRAKNEPTSHLLFMSNQRSISFECYTQNLTF